MTKKERARLAKNRRGQRAAVTRVVPTIRPVPQAVHYFNRTCVNQVTIRSDGYQNESTLGISFLTGRLFDVPNSDEFKALFDEFKILGMTQRFCYNRSSADSASPPSGSLWQQLPWLITVFDENDTAEILTLNDAMEYETFKSQTLTANKDIVITYKPQPALAYRNRWLSTSADVNVTHYAMKMAVDTGDVPATTGLEIGVLRVYTTFHLAFRCVQ